MTQEDTELVEGYWRTFDEQQSRAGPGGNPSPEWVGQQIPIFRCPDPVLESVYYFRWWVFAKHLKETPDGWVITEFLPQVPWAGKHNTIVCAVGHHFAEGRWLRNAELLPQFARFWYRRGGDLRSYSNWLPWGIRDYVLVSGDFDLAADLLPDMVEDFRWWEQTHQHESGLFWSDDDRDGMECSISGPGLRPTLNSYLYGATVAIAEFADRFGDVALYRKFRGKATDLRHRINTLLWDERDKFYKVFPLESKDAVVNNWDFASVDPARNVRELLGYTPWYFGIPDDSSRRPWGLLSEGAGFDAPFGPTTAERRHPRFGLSSGHECCWNGPHWPFATSVTLTAALSDLGGSGAPAEDCWWKIFRQFASAHRREIAHQENLPWIDENLDPFTGDWQSRRHLELAGWPLAKGGRERGRYYNHSTFCDLIIQGVAGLRPQPDGRWVVRPHLPETWAWFSLTNLGYQGREMSIRFDRDGTRFGAGRGLAVRVEEPSLL